MAYKNLVPEPRNGSAEAHDTVGQTRDVGWELGVRVTVPADTPFVWAFMLGEGLPIWLGDTTLTLAKKAKFTTPGGVHGVIRSFTAGDRIRLSWRPREWDHESVLQVTTRETREGTIIAFHQEELATREERKEMVSHWKGVLAKLEDAIHARY